MEENLHGLRHDEDDEREAEADDEDAGHYQVHQELYVQTQGRLKECKDYSVNNSMDLCLTSEY